MNTCSHEFVTGPFFLRVAYQGYVHWGKYPQTSIPVEHCPKCGALRLSEENRKYVGPIEHNESVLD